MHVSANRFESVGDMAFKSPNVSPSSVHRATLRVEQKRVNAFLSPGGKKKKNPRNDEPVQRDPARLRRTFLSYHREILIISDYVFTAVFESHTGTIAARKPALIPASGKYPDPTGYVAL